MKLFVTILEDTPELAIESIRSIDADHDGVEIRAERFPSYDVRVLRAATTKPIILTRRGVPFDERLFREAIEAGIDLVDVEYVPPVRTPAPHRVVLSYHDFDGMPDVERLAKEMSTVGAAHVKIAVTPKTFADNQRL